MLERSHFKKWSLISRFWRLRVVLLAESHSSVESSVAMTRDRDSIPATDLCDRSLSKSLRIKLKKPLLWSKAKHFAYLYFPIFENYRQTKCSPSFYLTKRFEVPYTMTWRQQKPQQVQSKVYASENISTAGMNHGRCPCIDVTDFKTVQIDKENLIRVVLL